MEQVDIFWLQKEVFCVPNPLRTHPKRRGKWTYAQATIVLYLSNTGIAVGCAVVMVALPQSIENALKDAGFSPTEILILNHLLAEEGMTLREIAAKTGKSTGVLDQAMKKLLRRRIVERQIINDTPKYVVTSLQSIIDWMEEDTRTRRQEIDRRYENFESFILTLERERMRPHVEHFDGFEGIKRAYLKLLEYGAKEIMGFVPPAFKEGEDPLRDFKVQWFRERYNKGAFLRVITHDVPLGRRYQSRDAFEYRKSLLVAPEHCPITLEKYVVNGVLATFDYNKRTAMFLHYPELVRSEREMFEKTWHQESLRRLEQANGASAPELSPTPAAAMPESIAVGTKVLSLLREFFVGPKSWIAIGFCAVLASVISVTMYQTTVRVNAERIRERVTAIAATATVEFRAEELDQLRTLKDVESPVYRTVVERLRQIRRRNPDIKYVYLLRPPVSGAMFAFIADADAEHPSKVPDTNGDGAITSADDLGFPGVQYDGSYIDVLRDHAYEVPVATREPYTDKWGTFFTGYAPIRDARGTLVALLAVDMTGKDLAEFNTQTMRPVWLFLLLFLAFLLVRFLAMNQSIVLSVLPKGRRHRAVLGAALALCFALSFGLYMQRRMASITRLYGEKAMAIATTAALQIDANDLALLRKAEDMKRPEYQRVFSFLNEVRNENPGTKYVTVFRKTERDGMWEIIADADANYDVYHTTDTNIDGILDESDENPAPGTAYDVDGYSEETFAQAFKGTPYYVVLSDQWGNFLSGNAPIFSEKGEIVAEINVNFDYRQIMKAELGVLLTSLARPFFGRVMVVFVLLFLVFAGVSFVVVHRKALRPLVPALHIRRAALAGLLLLALCVLGALMVRRAQQQSRIRAIGERAQAIASTAALLIDANDLEPLRKAADMRRPEYQKVFKILNDVRNQNPDILYIYIFRPTNVDGIWEFVVDADASFDFPFLTDINSDGTLNSLDISTWPGFAYDIANVSPTWYQEGLKGPYSDLTLLEDQWGALITGSAPILDSSGNAVAILGVDFDFFRALNSSR